MKTCRYSKGLYGITLGSTAETHRQSTAAQAVVHHGRSASGVGEFGGSTEIRGDSINSVHRWPEKRKQSRWQTKQSKALRYLEGIKCKAL